MDKHIIENIVNEHFNGTNKFLVDVKISSTTKIEVYIDSDEHIMLEDCSELNQYIESQLDREKEDYELIVSSAGITNPVLLTRQFQKYLGQKFSVIDKSGKKTIGELKSATDEGITITEKVMSKRKKGMKECIKSEEDIYFAKNEYVSATLFLDF